MLSAMERSDVPDGAPPLKRKIAAILAADVAGYSRLVAIEEEGTLRRLAASREIFDGLVHRGGGRIFNTAGDSVMCEFDSAVEAVRVAIEIQDSLAAASAGTDPAKRIQFRIGITIGDVVERGQDLLGDGVNIAARLQSITPPGSVCISRSVHEAVANKIPVEFRISARES
jgi:class 3 adenylate cyclase